MLRIVGCICILITAAIARDANIQRAYFPESNVTRIETPTLKVTVTAGAGEKGSGLWFFYTCPGKLTRCTPNHVAVAALTVASPGALKYANKEQRTIQFLTGDGLSIRVEGTKHGAEPEPNQSNIVVERLWSAMTVADFKRLARATSVSGIAGGAVRFAIPKQSQDLIRELSDTIPD